MADQKRARTKSGKFISDDPNTPEVNEAWVTTKPKKTTTTKKALLPKGSAEYQSMLLRGEISE